MEVLKMKFGMNEENIDAHGIRLYGSIDKKAKQFTGISEFISDPDEMIRRTLNHIDQKRANLGLPAYDPEKFGKSGDQRMLELEGLGLEARREAIYGVAAD